MVQRGKTLVQGLLILLLGAATSNGAAFAAEPTLDFNRDIRPILADKCFKCHGPDENAREAELRLDLEREAVSDRGGYQAILPGKPAASAVIERITSDDKDERMPPAESGKTLTPAEIETLRRWIAEGATYKQHWSFVSRRRPAVPKLPSGGSAANPIDHFLLARLARVKRRFSKPADPRTIARRLSFDLTGLPPDRKLTAAFLADPSPENYAKLVQALLDSPHYGERMAMYWLDLVRYADTNGIHGDNHRDHALYRDYVIDAFNSNMRFDRFTIEQLAGDLLVDPTRHQQIASGYNRLNMTTREGGAQAKEYRAKYAADRVRNASTVWLGSTLGCAECHDHKFDPFTQRDFYSFAAFFADLQEVPVGRQPPTRMPTPEQQAEVKKLDGQVAILSKQLNVTTPELAAAQVVWEDKLGSKPQTWTVLRPSAVKSPGGATLNVAEDGTIEATGESPEKDTYELEFDAELKGVTGLRLEVLSSDKLPQKGPGRADNGNFVVHEVTVRVGEKKLGFAAITASHSQQNWPVKAAGDGKPNTGWAILPKTGTDQHAVFELKENTDADTEQTLHIAIAQNFGSRHTLGRFRISATTATRPVRAEGADGIPAPIKAILAVARKERSEQQAGQLATYYRSIAPELKPVRDQIAALNKQKQAITNAAPQVLIALTTAPRMMRILPRGNWLDDSGEEVKPDTPAFLPRLKAKPDRASRLDLAHWLVDKQNPLVARVMVNRLWKLMFGQGLVKSLDDFGAQGTSPSHPGLLDWLASEFVDSGWDIKHVMKLIAMSRAYQQTSLAPPELRQLDPYNALLARQGRFRLDAEMIRDNALTISGLLVHRVGGQSVKPYQPSGYWKHLNFPKRTYQADQGEDQYRRGLYTYWCRTFLHPSMLAFDAPSREECTVERPRSNTPLAALVLLNDPSYVEASRAFAERILRSSATTTAGRLEFAFQETLGRSPSAAESSVLGALYDQHLAHFQQEAAAAQALVKVGQRAAPGDLDAAPLAAWTSVARVLFNLHETITRN